MNYIIDKVCKALNNSGCKIYCVDEENSIITAYQPFIEQFDCIVDESQHVIAVSIGVYSNKDYPTYEFAETITNINHKLDIGSLDYNIETKETHYKLASVYNQDVEINYVVRKLYRNLYQFIYLFYTDRDYFLQNDDKNSYYKKFIKRDDANNNFQLADMQMNCVCSFLKAEGVRFKYNKEKRIISYDLIGNDIPMTFDLSVLPEKDMITIKSDLPFLLQNKSTKNVVIASCIISENLINGSFNYDDTQNKIYFKFSDFYDLTPLSKYKFDYIFFTAISTVEEFNDKLLELNKNRIKLKDFINYFSSL